MRGHDRRQSYSKYRSSSNERCLYKNPYKNYGESRVVNLFVALQSTMLKWWGPMCVLTRVMVGEAWGYCEFFEDWRKSYYVLLMYMDIICRANTDTLFVWGTKVGPSSRLRSFSMYFRLPLRPSTDLVAIVSWTIGKYRGSNGNNVSNQLFPLAFCSIEWEKNDSSDWFMTYIYKIGKCESHMPYLHEGYDKWQIHWPPTNAYNP